MKPGNLILKALFVFTILLAVPKDSFAFHKYWCNYWCYCNKPCNCGYTQSTTPIDGGLSFLAAAGVAYGVRRYSKNKKQKQVK